MIRSITSVKHEDNYKPKQTRVIYPDFLLPIHFERGGYTFLIYEVCLSRIGKNHFSTSIKVRIEDYSLSGF